jgi:hypothetical protein
MGKGDSRAQHFPLANERSGIAGFPLCYNPAYGLVLAGDDPYVNRAQCVFITTKYDPRSTNQA